MEEKYTKVIAVGEEAINYLEDIKHNLQKNASFENIKVTKDVDKEFVRGLLDGIEVLYMLYDSSDKDVVNILKAISFMAQERRVLCIGLDICLKENKEDTGVVTVYYGKDMSKDACGRELAAVEKIYSDIEFEMYDGGQPLYPMFISAE